MNRENLQRMADYIRTVPQKQFDMGIYRLGDETVTECNSIGCVIGHCIVLDEPENIPRQDGGVSKDIDFGVWSQKFTGLNAKTERKEMGWDWCFSQKWKHIDNTPTGAALRIEWLLNHGLPENWRRQIIGSDPLCYITQSNI